MADRFFPNDFPDFVAEAEVPGGDGDRRTAGSGAFSRAGDRAAVRFPNSGYRTTKYQWNIKLLHARTKIRARSRKEGSLLETNT
jgi:hypothetical protein